jgi:ribosome-associated protein
MTGSKTAVKQSSVVSPKLKNQIVNVLEDLKGKDIVALDVSKLTDITDFMIVVSGGSNRQVKALADTVVEFAKSSRLKLLGVEGKENMDWVLIDLGDVVVHVMHPDSREFYNLEALWSDFGDDAQ